MDYEEKYKTALERAKAMIKVVANQDEAICFANTIFPELAESENEDERIRKAISQCVEDMRGQFEKLYSVHHKDAIAWLEKQGIKPQGKSALEAIHEQKVDNANKVERKFHEGDWVVYKNDICQIVKREEGCNKLVTVFGIEKELVNERNLSTARLWNIKDAKNGDILVDVYGNIGVFEKRYEINWHTYCYLDCEGRFISEGGSHGSTCYPATKEQRELLFSKMKEAGYEWDSEKKELRKIEQKLAEKVEPRFKVGDFIVNNNDGGIYQVTEIRDNEYCLWPLYAEIMGYLSIIDVDNEYHLWSLKDAKYGDILAFDNDTIVIFKDLYNATTFHSYCYIEDGTFNVSEDETPDWWEGKHFHPATKEQKDFFFKRMEEEGYKWDDEHKELKKIEL